MPRHVAVVTVTSRASRGSGAVGFPASEGVLSVQTLQWPSDSLPVVLDRIDAANVPACLEFDRALHAAGPGWGLRKFSITRINSGGISGCIASLSNLKEAGWPQK